MNEFAIGVVVGIALAAFAVWLAMRIVARRVDRTMARAARALFGKDGPE